MGGRVHIEPDDILDLLAEGWVLRPLEGAPPVGLEVMRFPNPLDRSQRQVDDLGHRPTGRGQPRVILSTHDHGHRLSHATRIARPRKIVNPMIVSVH